MLVYFHGVLVKIIFWYQEYKYKSVTLHEVEILLIKYTGKFWGDIFTKENENCLE